MTVESMTFETLEAAIRPKVLNYLRRFVGFDEAEDLTQEVFLKAYQGLDTFRGEAKWSTWIFQVATFTALDRLKSASHRASQALLPEGVLDGLGSPLVPSHDQGPLKEEMCHCIRDLVNDLPLDYRVMIHLSELKELPIGEVGKILGISPGAAKIRLHRARRMLRASMEQGCRIILDEQADIQCDRKTEV